MNNINSINGGNMESIGIQIQTVLYENSLENLMNSLESIQKAVVRARRDCELNVICEVIYGDASPMPILTEDFENYVKNHFNEIEFSSIYFNENTGTSRGHNKLAKFCKQEFLLLMNPDLLFAVDFFCRIFKPFSDKLTGMVEARQSPIEHSKEYNLKTGETSWGSGACTLIRKELFEEVNGYDEKSFFLYCDDVDLSWRVRMSGYRIIYLPSAIVYHAKKLSTSGNWIPTSAEKYFSAEAALMMAHKWSNFDRLNKLLDIFLKSNDENLKKAALNFREKKKNNELVKSIDDKKKISTFVGDYYAKPKYII